MNKKMPKKKDRRVFSHTAKDRKLINLRPVSMRGGIRL